MTKKKTNSNCKKGIWQRQKKIHSEKRKKTKKRKSF
jgi:hypothetical protein